MAAQPRLSPRTKTSFDSDDQAAVASLLIEHGYRAIDTRSTHEYARLIKGGALAVLYKSGSVLCQGSSPQPLISILSLAAEQLVEVR
jgi:hypothetical protein